jgi:O-antigen/teichoic acid export membrane protein
VTPTVSDSYRFLVGNVAARVGALVSLFVATVLLARNGGPAVVGVFALLHVLPSLVAMVVSSGLSGAVAYFLAGPSRGDRRVPFTIGAMALAGGAAGAALWGASAPLLQDFLFKDLSVTLVSVAGLAVLTRLIVVTAKSCSQGSDDLPGANGVIFAEEFMFLPAYLLLWLAGVRGYEGVVGGLLLADAVTASLAWGRLVRRGFFRDAVGPSLAVARRIAAYGLRAQTGVVITQLNLRLDFVILSVLAGPAVLGIYAIASKFAELVKILGMAVSYVLYPRFARHGRVESLVIARRLLPKAVLLTVGAAVPLWLAASVVIPAFYGSAFGTAITPARILLIGLAFEGAAGVITALLYGIGRPGLNSCAMAAGLVATVALDLILIPRFGAVGAAAASAVAYATGTLALGWFYWRLVRTAPVPASESTGAASAHAPIVAAATRFTSYRRS